MSDFKTIDTNLQLLTSIGSSDLSYLISTKKKINRSFYIKNIFIKKNKMCLMINIINLLHSIKQIIRIIQYYKNSINNFNIQVISKNIFFQYLIKILRAKNNNTHLVGTSKFNSKYANNILFYIDNFFLSNKENYYVINSFYRKIYFSIFCNTWLNSNSNGSYKIFNNINTYKKFLTILVIINLVQTIVTKYALKKEI